MRRRLQFSILITLPKSFSPSTGNMRSKFWRNRKKRKLSKVLIFDWSCDTKTAIFNFDIPAEKFFTKHGKCSFKFLKNLKKKQNFQKFDFLIDLMRRKVHFSILVSLPKTFSPSTVNVRSKFRRVWKKRELSEVWIFYWSFETKTAIFNFDNPAEKFFAKHGKCLFKVLKKLIKKIFQKFHFFDWPYETKTATFNFDIPAESLSAEHGNCSFEVLKILKKKWTFKSLIFW